MASIRVCSRTDGCGAILTNDSDVSTPECGHEYCSGCLLCRLSMTPPVCVVCGALITGWKRSWCVNMTQRTEDVELPQRMMLEKLQSFHENDDVAANAAHVVVAWKSKADGTTDEPKTYHISETIGSGAPSQREALGVLALVLRKALLEPDAELPQLPVVDYNAMVDRAFGDPSDMAHFFRVLGDPHGDGSAEISNANDSSAHQRRHVLASYVAFELLRVQMNREHRHPLLDWLARTVEAQCAPSDLSNLLTKLSIAAKESLKNMVVVREGEEFSSLRIRDRERAFVKQLSLKLHDLDNVGFTIKGKKVGYEQFIASAWKE